MLVLPVDQYQLIMKPTIICQIPHQAAINAIPPNEPKKLKISKSPSPEFCIPVSIAIDLQSGAGRLDSFPKL